MAARRGESRSGVFSKMGERVKKRFEVYFLRKSGKFEGDFLRKSKKAATKFSKAGGVSSPTHPPPRVAPRLIVFNILNTKLNEETRDDLRNNISNLIYLFPCAYMLN